jgi:hemerythrin
MNDNPNLPLTNDSKIDEIHDEEYELLVKLLSIIDDGSDDDITLAFEKFIEHMQMHFEHEQGLMKHQGYTMANVHEGEHYKVINEARYNLQNWLNFKDRWDLKEYFGEDFVAWLNQHIEAMDKPMVDFFKSEGVL